MADLLYAEGKKAFHFDSFEIKKIPKQVSETRNYLIHYDESIKDRGHVLDEKKIVQMNVCLGSILDYYLFKNLGLADKHNEKYSPKWPYLARKYSLQ